MAKKDELVGRGTTGRAIQISLRLKISKNCQKPKIWSNLFLKL